MPERVKSADQVAKMRAIDLGVRYGDAVALKEVSIEVRDREVLALIGPSGCGKSTFLRCLNRMNDTIDNVSITGKVELEGADIYASGVDPVRVRRRIGMVFQKSNPFPKSIFENVAFGLRVAGMRDGRDIAERVEKALMSAAIWDEVKDRLHESAQRLSGGQQQRICIARALAVEPEVLLMDEPASALDPIATAHIEHLVSDLKNSLSIVIVTHNMQQAARVSQRTGFFYMGRLVEVGTTPTIFTRPVEKQTEDYITGRFG